MPFNDVPALRAQEGASFLISSSRSGLPTGLGLAAQD